MSNELTSIPTEHEFNFLQIMARNAHGSQMYSSVGSEQKIFMILLAARELSISPLLALNGGISIIKGKVEIAARTMNLMIRRKGHSIKVVELNSKRCILEGVRADNGDTMVAQFTLDEAIAAGLSQKDVWKAYTEDMLYARAMSRLARRLFSDVIGNAYVEGEMGGNVPSKQSSDIQLVEAQEDTEEQKKQMMNEFASKFEDIDSELILRYLEVYAKRWEKSMRQTLLDYESEEKFVRHLNVWNEHQLKKQSEAIQVINPSA